MIEFAPATAPSRPAADQPAPRKPNPSVRLAQTRRNPARRKTTPPQLTTQSCQELPSQDDQRTPFPPISVGGTSSSAIFPKPNQPQKLLPLNTENRKLSSLLPQLRMRPIAKRRIRRLLAHAPSHLLLLRDLQLHRREAFALVRPVAKRLRRRISAGTPPISSRLHFFDHRRLPTTVRRIHHFHITRPRPRLNHQSPLNRPL